MAQEINDFTYALEGDNILISYTLTGKFADRYEVNLYRSTDGFREPLLMVEGDIGPDIQPGKNKTITWRAKEELGEFKGNLSLRLRAVFIPFLTFDLAKGTSFKRGKLYTVNWTFGGEPLPIKLELYKGSNKVTDLATSISGSSFDWQLAKKMGLDDGFYLRATGGGREARSEPFAIKRKVPMAAWLIPGVAVLGGVTYLILSAGTDPADEEIPDPIRPN